MHILKATGFQTQQGAEASLGKVNLLPKHKVREWFTLFKKPVSKTLQSPQGLQFDEAAAPTLQKANSLRETPPSNKQQSLLLTKLVSRMQRQQRAHMCV